MKVNNFHSGFQEKTFKIKNRSVVSENRCTKKERKKKKYKTENRKQIQTEFSIG